MANIATSEQDISSLLEYFAASKNHVILFCFLSCSKTKCSLFLLYFHIPAILPVKHLNNRHFGYSKIQERSA
jgi:hypothetical protein